jgi:hypothetical protein
MGFVSAIELQKPITRNRVKKGVALSTIRNNDEAYLQVRVDNATLKESRIFAGDSLDVLFDKEGRLGLIRRVKEGGWKLTNQTDTCARVRVRWAPGMPHTAEMVEIADVTCDEAEGIMFQLPEGVSFVGVPKIPAAEGKA